ncbi:hypothetical protein FG643_024570 [Salmonella enterica subsp. enterica serovar Amager]|uniref:hypothetical protein n=1 Tax=Salmonella enterica TaxID=28901 RepID=UPI001179D8C5|nr:hypothetical protein [Salmonella enterica]TRI39706.1 hypothetical protein FG643_024570 [Salmonella enterica subsp. enterica serovar Amager]
MKGVAISISDLRRLRGVGDKKTALTSDAESTGINSVGLHDFLKGAVKARDEHIDSLRLKGAVKARDEHIDSLRRDLAIFGKVHERPGMAPSSGYAASGAQARPFLHGRRGKLKHGGIRIFSVISFCSFSIVYLYAEKISHQLLYSFCSLPVVRKNKSVLRY